jgi:aryl-alcohol dehydrogenase-like predicted oxidoreductase
MGPPVPNEFVYDVVDTMDAVARETGKTIPEIALNWLLQRPTVASVIIGARNEQQLKQNLGAADWRLSPDQMKRLDEASAVPRPYPYWHQAQFVERTPLAV